jgi:hypothetical protein
LSAIISRATATGIGAPTPARMRQHDVALERGEVGRRDMDVRELAEAGVDAIDRLALGDDRRDGRRRPLDDRLAGGIERGHRAAIDRAPVAQSHHAGFHRPFVAAIRPLSTMPGPLAPAMGASRAPRQTRSHCMRRA